MHDLDLFDCCENYFSLIMNDGTLYQGFLGLLQDCWSWINLLLFMLVCKFDSYHIILIGFIFIFGGIRVKEFVILLYDLIITIWAFFVANHEEGEKCPIME